MSTAEASTGSEMTSYREAANAALRQALEMFPETLLFGEDVAAPGGVFGVTRGLQTEFGERVFDTPISESAIIGAALGASLVGRRPIVEIMWADFMFVGIDQLINHAANVRYLTRGRMRAPLTIRTQQGSLNSSSAQHSRCIEALLCHIPGLRVGLPSNPQDAYTMLLAGIADDDPTVIIEHRAMYDRRGAVTLSTEIPGIGGARVVREGTDVTLVATSRMVVEATTAAEALAREGVSIEVIDPRWLSPFDWDTVARSLSKTNRLAVVHEAVRTGGFGAEIAAQAAEKAFWDLNGPVIRIAAPDTPKPSAPTLEAVAIPDADRIADRIRKQLSDQKEDA